MLTAAEPAHNPHLGYQPTPVLFMLFNPYPCCRGCPQRNYMNYVCMYVCGTRASHQAVREELHLTVRKTLVDWLQSQDRAPDIKIYVTGHSMGGALANHCALDLQVGSHKYAIHYHMLYALHAGWRSNGSSFFFYSVLKFGSMTFYMFDDICIAWHDWRLGSRGLRRRPVSMIMILLYVLGESHGSSLDYSCEVILTIYVGSRLIIDSLSTSFVLPFAPPTFPVSPVWTNGLDPLPRKFLHGDMQ